MHLFDNFINKLLVSVDGLPFVVEDAAAVIPIEELDVVTAVVGLGVKACVVLGTTLDDCAVDFNVTGTVMFCTE